MPRYYFVIQFGDRTHDDPSGTSLRDHAAARSYALRVIRELKEGGGYDEPDVTMIVKDASGQEIFSIPFAWSH
jgi:hypothetical protein